MRSGIQGGGMRLRISPSWRLYTRLNSAAHSWRSRSAADSIRNTFFSMASRSGSGVIAGATVGTVDAVGAVDAVFTATAVAVLTSATLTKKIATFAFAQAMACRAPVARALVLA